jgi:mono/diheme cytochrome c family protein
MKMATGLLLFLAALVSGEQSISVWDGVYMPDQATRGKVIYGEQCAVCHGDELADGPSVQRELERADGG